MLLIKSNKAKLVWILLHIKFYLFWNYTFIQKNFWRQKYFPPKRANSSKSHFIHLQLLGALGNGDTVETLLGWKCFMGARWPAWWGYLSWNRLNLRNLTVRRRPSNHAPCSWPKTFPASSLVEQRTYTRPWLDKIILTYCLLAENFS